MNGLREWLANIVSAEILQKREEGCDPSPIEKIFHAKKDTANVEELECLWSELFLLEPGSGFRYVEPSDLEEIKAESSGLPGRGPELKADRLEDRIYGAWLGRCAGCLLGKPVEGWQKEDIEGYLRSENAYPLRNYFPKPSKPDKRLKAPGICLGEIDGMPRDDDIDYTILGLHILESHGLGVTSEEIAAEWLSCLSYGSVYTAEKVVYMNLVNKVPIPETARYLNPYREWIGAQIRADAWAYALPGRPAKAAELAYRDARITHVRNGIYGEMMVSAMVAAAFATDDPKEVVAAGISVIPKKSRLFEAVSNLLKWTEEFDTWRECWVLVKKNYGNYSPVHTINNALNVILAILYGGGDYTETVGIAVMEGWDTDCNGATAGSIIGAMKGPSGIPVKWTEPLGDRVESYVRGYQECRILDLASRTHGLAIGKE